MTLRSTHDPVTEAVRHYTQTSGHAHGPSCYPDEGETCAEICGFLDESQIEAMEARAAGGYDDDEEARQSSLDRVKFNTDREPHQ